MLVDTAIVGRLGTEQLGGLALAATVLSFVVAGCNFLTYGTTERVARRLGAGDDQAAARVGVQAMWLAGGAVDRARAGAGARCDVVRPSPRRGGRRARPRRHLPTHRFDRCAVHPHRPLRPGCAARRRRLPHPTGDPPRCQRPQRRPRDRVRVRPRLGRAGVGRLDGDRPGRGGGRVPRRHPPASRRSRFVATRAGCRCVRSPPPGVTCCCGCCRCSPCSADRRRSPRGSTRPRSPPTRSVSPCSPCSPCASTPSPCRPRPSSPTTSGSGEPGSGVFRRPAGAAAVAARCGGRLRAPARFRQLAAAAVHVRRRR